MSYTKGKLKVAYGSAWVDSPYEPTISILLADRKSHNTSPTERDANVRRAVACWNALEGLSTEEIEEGTGELFDLMKRALLRGGH